MVGQCVDQGLATSYVEQNQVFHSSFLAHYGLSESVETLDGCHTLGVTSENST